MSSSSSSSKMEPNSSDSIIKVFSKLLNDEDDVVEDDDPDDDLDTKLRKIEAIKKAVQIPLIVQKILKNASTSSLKKCRLQSLLWYEMASKIILERDSTKVTLVYDCDWQMYRKYSRQHDCFIYKNSSDPAPPFPTFDIHALTTLLEKSVWWPCTDFRIQDGDLSQISELFKIEGPKIKSLSLIGLNGVRFGPDHPHRIESSKDTIKNILMKDVPNLIKLTMPMCLFNFEWLREDQLSLPNLKFLGRWVDINNFGVGPILPHDEVMRAAPKLETIEEFRFLDDVDDMQKFVSTGRIHAVKTVKVTKLSSRKKLNIFINHGPQIENLTIDMESVKREDRPEKNALFSQFLQNLLRVSANHVKILNLYGICHYFPAITFPTMDKVTRVGVVAVDKNKRSYPPVRLFPRRINLATTFPHLKILDFSKVTLPSASSSSADGEGHQVDENDAKTTWEKLFPPPDAYRENLESVTTLKISLTANEDWMHRLECLCPNFTKLVVHMVPRLRGFCPKFFATVFTIWKHLQFIEIQTRSKDDVDGNDNGRDKDKPADMENWSWDSIFTGMSFQQCVIILGSTEFQEKNQLPPKPLTLLRERPSICNLEGLRELKLVIHCDIDTSILFFTKVSHVWAFSLMPNLKVSLFHGLSEELARKAFASIAPFVNLEDIGFA